MAPPSEPPFDSRRPLDSHAGAAVYAPWVLKLYDAWVLGISNRWAWQCPTRDVLLPSYRHHAGLRHLDVGTGTGFYLEHAGFAPQSEVSLLDLNANSLQAAAKRFGRPVSGLHREDILAPLAALGARRFDSIAMFYLLHCLPGCMQDKERAFVNLKPHLAADGVLYGATILGDSAGHNAFGRALMRAYNRKGIFGNRDDSEASLRDSLGRHFERVRIDVHGKVALFLASGPIG